MDAVESVNNQTLPRNNYEIIVIKGFNDYTLDNLLSGSVDLVIDSKDQWQGSKWYEAIMKTKGEIIAFLDDDDLFSKSKLEHIYRLYNELKFEYYRNDILPFSQVSELENTKSLVNKITVVDEDFSVKRKLKLISNKISSISSSSTVVSKHFLIDSLEHLEEIKIAFDSYLFYLSLYRNVRTVIDENKLTYYRKHASFTNTNPLDIENFKKRIKMVTYVLLFDYNIIKKIVDSNINLKEVINNDIFQFNILLSLSDNKKFFSVKDLFYYLIGVSAERPRLKLFHLLIIAFNLVTNKLAICIFLKFRQYFSRQ